MQEQMQEQVKSFSEEKFKALADKHGWTANFAHGFTEGEARRRAGEPAPRVALIGIDQYSLGYRAGFFDRRAPHASRNAGRDTAVVMPHLRLQA